jgi:hypothetical protein
MHARAITFHQVHVSLKVRCRSTRAQTRMMYLAGRPAWEAKLAIEWRAAQSTCWRCGGRMKCSLWCSERDP